MAHHCSSAVDNNRFFHGCLPKYSIANSSLSVLRPGHKTTYTVYALCLASVCGILRVQHPKTWPEKAGSPNCNCGICVDPNCGCLKIIPIPYRFIVPNSGSTPSDGLLCWIFTVRHKFHLAYRADLKRLQFIISVCRTPRGCEENVRSSYYTL